MELLPCRNAYDVAGSCGHPDGSLSLPCRGCSSWRNNVGTLCKQWPQPATDQGRRRFICKDRISKLGIAMALGVNWPRSSKLWNASTKYGRISASCKRGWPRMIYKRLVRHCPAPQGMVGQRPELQPLAQAWQSADLAGARSSLAGGPLSQPCFRISTVGLEEALRQHYLAPKT